MFKIGDIVIFRGNEVTIVERHKGHKTKKPNMQSSILFLGYASFLVHIHYLMDTECLAVH